MNKIKESDLYMPIKDWLVMNNYTVMGEVNKCDLAAKKGDDLIIVELKLRLNLDLILQAMDRKKISDSVYIAVPNSISQKNYYRWKKIKQLLRQLEVGLIFVNMVTMTPEIIFNPLPYSRRKNKKRRLAVIKEINSRSADYNLGGINKRKIITAYREECIFIATCLYKYGELTTKKLKELGTGKKTSAILCSNFYKWFNRVGRATYSITTKCRNELDFDFIEIKKRYLNMLEKY